MNTNSIYCGLNKKCRDAYSKDLASKVNDDNTLQEEIFSKEKTDDNKKS